MPKSLVENGPILKASASVLYGWIPFLSALCGWTFLFPACQNPPAHTFTDITEAAGIDFRYTFGDTSYRNILESSGSGITVFDANGDGFEDMLFLNGTWLEGISDASALSRKDTPDRLYLNRGDGTFTAAGTGTSPVDTRWSMAAIPVDLDTDGDLDLYLLNFGPNAVFRNLGDGTFREITGETGLEGPDTLNGWTKWSVGASFWDADLEGRPDVMLGSFLAFDPAYETPGHPEIMPHPGEYHGQASLLYLQGPDGRFREATRGSGLFFPEAKCMGLSVYDEDGDGRLDLVQANDHQPNFLFRANGDGTFREEALPAGVAVNDDGAGTGSMHPTIGDVDGDGRLDILVTDLEHGALYRNRGDGTYEDITARSGLKALFGGKGVWGACLFDMDNDGDLDLFTANGAAEVLKPQPPLLLDNDGTGRFTDAGRQLGDYGATTRSGRAAVTLDMDNDGDLDLAVSHLDGDGRPVLLRNDLPAGHHWIGLHLRGPAGGPALPGSRVTITSGDRILVRLHQPANGYLSVSDSRLHAGLGGRDRVDRIEVAWPDGRREAFGPFPADRYITLRQGTGKPVPSPDQPRQ